MLISKDFFNKTIDKDSKRYVSEPFQTQSSENPTQRKCSRIVKDFLPTSHIITNIIINTNINHNKMDVETYLDRLYSIRNRLERALDETEDQIMLNEVTITPEEWQEIQNQMEDDREFEIFYREEDREE